MAWCFFPSQDDVDQSHDQVRQPPTTWPNMACNSEDCYDEIEDSDEADIAGPADTKTSLGQIQDILILTFPL